MSDDEVKAVLEAYGMDLEKVERDGEAFVEWLFKQTDGDDQIPGAVAAVAEAPEGSGTKEGEPAADDAPGKTDRKPRTPEEQLQAIVDTVRDAEMEEMEQWSPEEVRAVLRAQGLDPERMGQRVRALVERVAREMEAGDARADGAGTTAGASAGSDEGAGEAATGGSRDTTPEGPTRSGA